MIKDAIQSKVQLTIIGVLDKAVGGERRVEIGHQGGDVLRGCQPTVNVLPGVQKSTRGYRYVTHLVTVERKVEPQLDRLMT